MRGPLFKIASQFLMVGSAFWFGISFAGLSDLFVTPLALTAIGWFMNIIALLEPRP